MDAVRTRAALFDLGGTLYDYRTLEPGNREALVGLVRWAGCDAPPLEIARVYQDALRRVFHSYLPRSYYLHRDLFSDALLEMARDLGVKLSEEHLERHRHAQRERQGHDFAFRDGVPETLGALRERGLYLGIVSNIDQEQLDHLTELAALDRFFDCLISSERAGSCKPDQQIFERALELAGCAPEEALFVGDSIPQDIAGANRAGLRSVLIWHCDGVEPPDREPRPRHVIRRIPELLDLL